MNRRHLRAYLFDSDGQLLPPLMRGSKVSTALLPVMKLQGMVAYARDLVAVNTENRRKAAIRCLVEAQQRVRPSGVKIYAVALVACPDRATSAHFLRREGRLVAVTADNAYLGSFAAVGAHNQIWAGDVMRETLGEMEDRLGHCVRFVRTKPLDALSSMFEAAEQ